MEKLNRAAKCSILGPQNLGSGGGARAPGPPPWIRGWLHNFKVTWILSVHNVQYYARFRLMLMRKLHWFRLKIQCYRTH